LLGYGQAGSQIDGGRRFSNAPLLVSHSHYS
jgi:hypothetical protein